MAGLIGSAISAGVSIKSAREERKFRREMATTAYQYTMADMRKAGLNPMLAFSQGPSAVPSAGALPKVDIDTSGVASTAMQVKKFGSELAAINQGTETASALQAKHEADTAITNAGVPLANLKNEMAIKAITSGKQATTDWVKDWKKKLQFGTDPTKSGKKPPTYKGTTRPRGRSYPPRGFVMPKQSKRQIGRNRGSTGSY